MNFQDYSCPTIVLLKEKVLLLLGLQDNDGFFKKDHYLLTDMPGSRDAIASKNDNLIAMHFSQLQTKSVKIQ